MFLRDSFVRSFSGQSDLSDSVKHDPQTSGKTSSRRYVARRALLYVPGNDEKKLRKIPAVNVDCAVLDCEDGVAVSRKEEARMTITKMLDEIQFGRTEPILRINSVSSEIADNDFKVLLEAKNLPPTIMLPKVEEVSHIEWFAERLSKTMKEKSVKASFGLIIFVESAIGLINLIDICKRAVELTDWGAPFHLDGIVFGSDDFCADIGAVRTTDASELLYARQKVVLICKAFRLQAVDLVHTQYKDLDDLRRQCVEGARMGFTGKQVIHPLQIPIVQEVFSPSAEKIEWATELIKAFNEHEKEGKGAFTFRGNMVDKPLLLQAQNIVQLVDAIKASGATKQTSS